MKTKTTPFVVPTSPATVTPGGFTLGLDLGDRSHHVCAMDATGQIVREGSLLNTRPALAKLMAEFAFHHRHHTRFAPATPLRISLCRKLRRMPPSSHVLDLFTPVNLI